MAFLGISIPSNIGKILTEIDVPGEKEDSSKYHITLLYFGDNWPLSIASKTMEALYELLTDFKPFTVKVSTVTCFPKREDNPVPIIAKVESKELHKLNEKIKEILDKEDIEYSKTFKDYKPHITLAYADKEIDEFEIDDLHILIPEITLWPCDYDENRLFINFRLNGNMQDKKSAFLMQKSDFFYKLSQS